MTLIVRLMSKVQTLLGEITGRGVIVRQWWLLIMENATVKETF